MAYVPEVVSQLRNQLQLPAVQRNDRLVDIDRRLQSLSWARCGSADPPTRIAALVGMGGSGKSTVAAAFFGRASSQFARKAFLRVGHEALPASVMRERQRELMNSLLLLWRAQQDQ